MNIIPFRTVIRLQSSATGKRTGNGSVPYLQKNLGMLDVIAEDLGFLTDSVIEMVEESGFPGMKVLAVCF